MNPNLILVTGASGVIGVKLVRKLEENGYRVKGLVLPNDPFLHRLKGLSCEIRTGDVSQVETLAGMFEGVHTVFHLAAALLTEDESAFRRVNVEGTRNMISGAEAAGVKHFIHISSASVIYPRTTPYSRSKREGEAIVKSRSTLNYTIVRPTLVYEQHSGQEFWLFSNFLSRLPVILLVGDGHALKSPVYVEDLVSGLVAIADNPKTYGKTYNLSGGEDITLRELAQLLLQKQGLHKPLISIPVTLCELAAKLVGPLTKQSLLFQHTLAGLTQDANLDCSEARQDLGYQPLGIRKGIELLF